MSASIYYIVYQTTNLVNGKIYIGVHKTTNVNDSYLGSGVGIKAAINKHGRENFTREVLFELSSPEEMYAKEEELVDAIFVARQDTYNMSLGGYRTKGKHTLPHSDETKRKIGMAHKGKVISESHKAQLSKAHSGKVISEEMKERIRRALTGCKRRKRTAEEVAHHKASITGKKLGPMSDSHKAKISESKKSAPMSAKHVSWWKYFNIRVC